MWGTWIIGAERNRLDSRITAVITTVERLAESVDRLASGVASNTTDRYTRSDHAAWCALAEARNKGWHCVDLPYRNAVVPLESVSPRTDAQRIIRETLKDK